MSEKNRDNKNRWRNVTIAFRMSPEENEELDLRVKLCGYQTRQEYIIESVLHQKVTAVGNRGLGSIDFQAAARSVLIVGRVKDEPEIRVICHVKSSLAPEGDAIAFRLDKEKGFHWIGKYDISADDLLSGDGRGQKIRSAKDFLKEILANGSMEQAKIAEEAEERGIKKKTLWNAKKELQIDSVKIGNKWFWMLQEE